MMPRTLYGITIFAGIESIWALTFAEVDITDFMTSLGFLLTAIFAGITGIMAARRRREVEAVKAIVTEVSEKTKVIEGHVNSAASKSDAIIAAQETQLGMLRATIATQEKQAALLAQARAVSEGLAAAAAVPPAPLAQASHAESLEQIDQNTAETAKNTARTEAVVQDLKDQQKETP